MFPASRVILLFVALVAAPLFPSQAAEVPLTGFAKWEKEISAFEETDKTAPPPKNAIVFVGSSSIRKWTTVAEDFPHHRVINRGFGGSMMVDSLHFADRIVLPYEPRYIVVYAGGNDINAKKTPETVFTDFKEFVTLVHAKLPKTPIAFISIAGNPKRWAQVEDVKKANALIEAYTKQEPNLVYIDVFHAMLGADGLPKPEIFSGDQLHMNPEGYKLWTEIVGKYLPAADLP